MGMEEAKGSNKVKLTKRVLDALSPRESVYTLWDVEIPGFGVRVMTSGQRSFVLKYSINRQQRWITLGRFGDLTLEEGRKLALSRRGEVAKGIDPTTAIRAHRTAPSVKELIDRFIDEHVVPKTKASTAKGYIRHLRKVIEPRLGKLLVKNVTSAEISNFHHELSATPRQANQAVAILRVMFELAEIWGYRPISLNPCSRISMNPINQRERHLSDEELFALGEALTEAEKGSSIPAPALSAIRLLIFTGARHSEILELQWSQVDLQKKVLNYRAEQHKTGRKTGAKVISLNKPAIEILNKIRRTDGNPFVFPGLKAGSHFVGLQKIWERIRARVSEMEESKVRELKKRSEEVVNIQDVRIHDLRHTFASVGVSDGLSLPTVGSLLGHTQPSMTQRYAHMAPQPKALASEQIAASIAKKLKGKKSLG